MAADAGQRVGIFGGTFDPVHIGHLVAASEALEQLALDQLLFVPAGRPPHKPGQIITSDEDRWSMLELAIGGRPGFALSDADLRRSGPSYTVDLLSSLRERLPGVDLYFLMGADSLAEFHTWHEPATIVSLATIVVAGRPGFETDLDAAFDLTPQLAERTVVIDVPLIECSATDIRSRVSQGRSIWYQVPKEVEQYIGERNLYR